MEMYFKTNKLEFLGFTEPKIRINGAKRIMGLFRCECGNEKIYDYSAVKNSYTKQCFKCARISASEKMKKHNLIEHTLYRKWQDMKKRCYNQKVDRYKNYGALGIKVCDEWKNNFLNFYNWSITNGWSEGLTIEREDNYKNYCPENCKYVTHTEQGYNKKNTYFVCIDGIRYSLSKLVNNNNISNKYSNIWIGLKNGKSIEFFVDKYNIDVSLY